MPAKQRSLRRCERALSRAIVFVIAAVPVGVARYLINLAGSLGTSSWKGPKSLVFICAG